MDWSPQARSIATSPEFCSGWVLQLAHLADAENRQDVRSDNVRTLHSTTQWSAARRGEPLDLTNFLSKLQILKTFVYLPAVE